MVERCGGKQGSFRLREVSGAFEREPEVDPQCGGARVDTCGIRKQRYSLFGKQVSEALQVADVDGGEPPFNEQRGL